MDSRPRGPVLGGCADVRYWRWNDRDYHFFRPLTDGRVPSVAVLVIGSGTRPPSDVGALIVSIGPPRVAASEELEPLAPAVGDDR